MWYLWEYFEDEHDDRSCIEYIEVAFTKFISFVDELLFMLMMWGNFVCFETFG